MKFLLLISLFALALSSNALDMLIPLYLYPGDSGSAWSNVFSTIEANPSLQWQIVINPNSGPGTTGMPTDQNQIAGIAKLNSYSNVNVLGYVNTDYTKTSASDVNAEVDVYAKWASYSGANIKIGGIYFDCVDDHGSYYQGVAEHARSSIPSAHVSFNPGTIAPTDLFSYCDTMVEFEASYSDYQSQKPIDKIPEEYRAKSALQIYSTPEGTDVTSLVAEMAGDGIQAVYFGEDCCYKVLSATLLKNSAEAVTDAGGSCSDEL